MRKLLDLGPLQNVLNDLSDILPTLLGALLYILVSWILLRVILFIVKRSLRFTKVDTLMNRISDSGGLFGGSRKIQPSKIILTFVKWFLILVLLIIGSDLFGLTVVSNEVGKLIGFLPRMFSALVIFGFGLYLATIIKKSVQGMLKSFDLNGSKLVGAAVFYILVAIVSITALNQAGVNTDIITNNLTIILGAFLTAFTLALGLGSRDVVFRLLLGFYSRKNFSIGQRIRIEEFEGTIVSIDNICMTVEGQDARVIYPIKTISNKKIEILSQV